MLTVTLESETPLQQRNKVKISLCTRETESNFHSAPTKQQTKIQQSHLAVGKLGRKVCPVDCLSILKVTLFPKIV